MYSVDGVSTTLVRARKRASLLLSAFLIMFLFYDAARRLKGVGLDKEECVYRMLAAGRGGIYYRTAAVRG